MSPGVSYMQLLMLKIQKDLRREFGNSFSFTLWPYSSTSLKWALQVKFIIIKILEQRLMYQLNSATVTCHMESGQYVCRAEASLLFLLTMCLCTGWIYSSAQTHCHHTLLFSLAFHKPSVLWSSNDPSFCITTSHSSVFLPLSPQLTLTTQLCLFKCI